MATYDFVWKSGQTVRVEKGQGEGTEGGGETVEGKEGGEGKRAPQ